jgi:8-oxo-dGTP pyrophosphatase MutT (NUDIX family)
MTQTHVVAKVLLVSPDNKVLTMKRSSTAPRRPSEDDIPGGWVDEGEDFTTAAIRETEEEAGIVLAPEDINLIYTVTAMTDKGNTCWLFYVGHTQNTDVKLSDEHESFEWRTVEEAIESIQYQLHKDFLVYARDNDLL